MSEYSYFAQFAGDLPERLSSLDELMQGGYIEDRRFHPDELPARQIEDAKTPGRIVWLLPDGRQIISVGTSLKRDCYDCQVRENGEWVTHPFSKQTPVLLVVTYYDSYWHT